MADVGSLGEYKVVVTADYSQLKTQFDAMSNFVSSTTKVMSDNLNKTMGGINATMISQLKTTVDQLKKSFDGLDTTTKKSGDGFKTYAQQIKEAEKAAQKCHQEIGALQEKMATSSMSQTDLARLDQLKAKFRELREHADNLKSAQADYNMRIKETQNLEAMAAKAKKQADQEALKQLQQQAKEQAEAVKRAAKEQAEAVKQAAKEQTEAINQANNRIRSASGFGDYAKRIREEEKATEQLYKQQGQAILAAEERAIAGRTAAHKAGWEEIIKQEKIAAQEAENFRKQQGQAILAAEERAIAGRTAQHKAAWQEIVKQEDALDRQKQTEHNRNQQRIKQMQTQYNVAYAEINKYLQSHAKMSEAVFIRLQGKLQAITAEMQRMRAMPVIRNPLGNMNYADYEKQFSKFGDMMESLKHHLTWMASAAAIGVTFGIPAKTISTIAEVEKQMAQMKQVNEGVRNEQEILNKTTQDFIGIAQKYGHSVDEIIKSGVLWGRAYKDLNTVMQLTNLSAKLAVADNMNVDLANRAVESVINGYQKQGQAIQFATHVVDSWTKIAHNAQSSATDLAEALMRTGAAAKAVGVDFDTTNALASTMIKATGRSGAEIGNALKSVFSSIHSDKAIKQLEALGIEMYKVDEQGQKHFRNLHDVFVDLMITSHTTSQNMEKDLLAISGGKFQWSKVASVLGSYEDFIKSYGMSISAAGFSNDQIAAQLDTINRKYEQLKATMTGIATGMGASGLSAYIKNILASLNRFAQAMQRIPTSTYDMIGSLIKLGAIFGSTIVIIRTLVTGIYGLRAAYVIATTAQAANTAGTTVNTAAKAKNYAMSLLGVNAARAQATASVTAAGAMAAETAATEAATVATGGFAATVTAATGGLNLIIAAIAAAVVGFFAYNTTVSATAESQDKLKESSEELIAIEQQKLDMVRKEADFVETLIRAHFKLAEQVDNTSNSEQKNEQIKRDLQTTDKELARIIGEDGLKRIQSSKDVNTAVEHEREVYKNKAKNIVQNMINVATAEQEFNQKTLQGIVDRIDALKSEVSSWDLWSQAVHAAMQVYAGYLDLKEKGVDWTLSHSDPNSAQYQRAAEQKASIANERAWANKRPEGVEEKIAELEGKKLEVEKKMASNSLQLANLELQLAQIESGKGLEDLPTDVTDSGIVNDEDKDKKKKGTKTPKGAKEADNSPMAMSYRYLTSAKHLDKNFVAGLLGNAIRETGGWDLNPDADNGSHRGLFQWSYNDASRTGRWYDFMDTFLKERNISESQYWAMDKDQKRTLQLDFGLYEMQEGKEWASYKKILDQRPSTPEQWASLINQHFERSGEPAGSPIDMERQGNARQIAEKYGKNNGEINYTDIDSLIKKNYQEVKRVYDEKLESLKYEREKIGQSVSASEKLNLYKEIVNPNDFAALKEARKDYKALLLEAIKEERKRLEASKSATDTQVKAVEKMADSEIAFAEKLGLIDKADVRKYEWDKNESNYAKQKPLLESKLAATVAPDKGTADDMLEAYRGYVYAKTDLDAKYYAEKMFNLSRDVDATMKALNEVYKLEQSYYEKRKKINDEEFLYKSRYATTFIDSLTNGIQSGLEGILNRTKSFAEAFRDIFKGLVQDIIKLFSQDFAERIKKWLSNAIFKPKATGNKAGAYEDIVGIKSAGGKSKGGSDNSFDLMGWAQSSLSSLGGGTGKGKGVGQNPLVKALGGYSFASEMRKAVQPGMIALRNTTQMTINGMSNITQQGMQTISGGIQQGTQAMTMTWQGMEVSKQMATEIGNAGIVASSQTTAATVQATTAQMMGWIMAVLALFSLFGGGGGSSTTETHDSVNLGRSPDSYYMTPSPVLQSTTFNVPSFDIGGNIEQDMFAMVHKNEMVLTPEQANVIRETAKNGGSLGGSMSGSNANIKSNIQVSTVDSRGFERVLRDYNRDLSKSVKKGIRNGYLTAKGLM